MDTAALELETMQTAFDGFKNKNHTFQSWEPFLGGAVRICECSACHRFALAEVFPNGDDESGNQTYESDVRGSAILFECSAMPNVANRNTAKHSRAELSAAKEN